MKNILLVALLATASSSGQTKTLDKKPGGGEQELTRIEQQMTDALVKGDATLNQRYLAESYVFTGPDGIVQDKARAVADVKSGDLKFQSSTLDDIKVHVYGDTAVVTYGSTDKGTYKGKDISGRYRWTDVFIKRDGKWQIVSGQGTPIPKN
jgi:ketosteroid isomerase-like protein